MRIFYWAITVAYGLLSASGLTHSETADSAKLTAELTGDYLGQEPPGLKPELFAEGLVSTGTHQERDVTFSPDLTEFYFSRDAAIMVMKQVEGDWTMPRPVCFASELQEFEAFVAPDNLRLYYISRRLLPGETEPSFYHIWFVQRDGASWGAPRLLSDQRDFYPTITGDGVMYFTDANNDLYRTKLVDGFMSTREKLTDSVNTAAAEYNACIAPDESFIIFTSFGWGAGFGGGDLFVSFREEDDTWSRPLNMGGGINSSGHEYCPAISPDQKYMFFTSNVRGTEDIYWVDAAIIDSIRFKDLNTADMLFEAVAAGGVGVGREFYADLKARYADYCYFDGRHLTGVGDRLLDAGRTAEAIEVMMLGAELLPQQQSVVQRLKLAVVAGDDSLLGEVIGELKANQSGLTRNLEARINGLGYRLMGWQKLLEAIKVFRLNVELFPGSFNTYDSYAEALLNNGDTLASIENYEKSLQLNPENTNAERILTTLRGE